MWEKETHFRQQETSKFSLSLQQHNSLQASHVTIFIYLPCGENIFIKYISALLTSSDLGRWEKSGLLPVLSSPRIFCYNFIRGWEVDPKSLWPVLKSDIIGDSVPVKIYFHSPLMFTRGDVAFAIPPSASWWPVFASCVNMMNMFVFWIVSIGNKNLLSYQNTCREMLHFYTEGE